MSDLRSDVRTAIEGVARTTPAPPFAVVRRRAAARQRRVVATAVGGTAVAALAAGAVFALPSGRDLSPTDGGRLKPYEQFRYDEEARAEYARCRDARRTPGPASDPDRWTVSLEDTAACFRAVGYEPPPGSVVVPS